MTDETRTMTDHDEASAVTSVDAPARRRRRRKPLTFWQELPLLIGLAIVLALLIKTFAFQAFVIPSESMESTVMTHDRVLTNKLVYDVRDPHRGEVVVFGRTGAWPDEAARERAAHPPSTIGRALEFVGLLPSGTDFIKRVVGLPGDTISCCDARDHMLVNGQPLDETAYTQGGNKVSSATLGFTGSVVVPPGQLFVMGDNREHSADSRLYGTIPIDSVVGRAVVVIWPRSHWKGLRVPGAVERFASTPAGAAGLPAVGALAFVLPMALRPTRRAAWRRAWRRTTP